MDPLCVIGCCFYSNRRLYLNSTCMGHLQIRTGAVHNVCCIICYDPSQRHIIAVDDFSSYGYTMLGSLHTF